MTHDASICHAHSGLVVEVVLLTTLIVLCEKAHQRKLRNRRQRELAEKAAKQQELKDQRLAEETNRNQNNQAGDDGMDDDDNDDRNDDEGDDEFNEDSLDMSIGTFSHSASASVRFALPRWAMGSRGLETIDVAQSREAVVERVRQVSRYRSTQSECIADWREGAF